MPLLNLQAARERWVRRRGLREILLYFALAAAYVLAANLGFRAALVVEQVSPAWPPSGLALWALLIFGRRAWPAIWLGALAANLTAHEPILAAAGIATGNTLEALAGAWLLQSFADVDRSLDRLRHVTALIMLGAVVSTTIGATIGVTTLCAAGLQDWSRFGMLWRMWWLGDAMGDLLVGSLLLTLRFWKTRTSIREVGEIVLLEGVAVGTTVLVFATRVAPLTGHPLEYTVFPLVIWAGLRFGHPGAALVSATISSIAIWGTLNGTGPFASVLIPPQESLILLQIYTGVTAASGLVLGAAIADRNRSDLLRRTDHLLTTILSEERDLKHATPRILQVVCETLEWEVGIVWQVDVEQQKLDFVDSWHRLPRLDEFVADSRTRRFRPGIGLPGRVWSTAHPAWIYDVTIDPNFPRLATAKRLNLHGGFGFPLLVGTHVLGVMEFFTSDPRQVDRPLLALMEAAGAQIGQFIERRRAEQRVDESEALSSAIVNAALDCVVTVNGAGAIMEFNPAATHTFGFTREAAIGRELAELLVPPRLRDRHRQAFRRCVETGESHILGKRLEMPAQRADGTEFIVELAITRVGGGAGQPVFTAHMRDITDRKRAENEREQLLARERTVRLEAEAANRSKDQFLATVSHELRTPLTAILGWASMLKTRTFDPQRIQQIYESLERNALAQAQIVGDLLDVSRIITGQLRLDSEPVDVCDAALLSLETIRPTAVAKQISLVSNVPATPCLISGDSARLQQIIWNLLSNAAKFTPAGGTITVSVRQDPSHVVIEVRDSGIGIAPELLPRVFDRFWQADGSTTRVHGGLGLGLALVRHLVELHGGEVSATSGGEGCGSTFVVWMPIRRGDDLPARPAVSSARRPPLPGADLKDVRALVVDDDVETRDLFSEILAGHGARVVCAGSAAEAFEIVERELSDVIVMDIGMPTENGFSLLRRIRAYEKKKGSQPTPAIAVTAYAGASARAEVMRAGFAAYLSKPAPPGDMLSAILQVIGPSRRHQRRPDA